MERRDNAATQPLLRPVVTGTMDKYGTFSRLFGAKKPSTDSSTDTDQQAAPQPVPSPNPSRKRCLRISLIVMFSSGVVLAVGLLAGLLTKHASADDSVGGGNSTTTTRPNIVFIMTDDQDKRLGSTDYMTVLNRELIAKGTEFTNHYTTMALCCPARSSLFRGQQIHNTNITNVIKPGGTYNKWVLSQQDQNYLPFWLNEAGYRTECKSNSAAAEASQY